MGLGCKYKHSSLDQQRLPKYCYPGFLTLFCWTHEIHSLDKSGQQYEFHCQGQLPVFPMSGSPFLGLFSLVNLPSNILTCRRGISKISTEVINVEIILYIATPFPQIRSLLYHYLRYLVHSSLTTFISRSLTTRQLHNMPLINCSINFVSAQFHPFLVAIDRP